MMRQGQCLVVVLVEEAEEGRARERREGWEGYFESQEGAWATVSHCLVASSHRMRYPPTGGAGRKLHEVSQGRILCRT